MNNLESLPPFESLSLSDDNAKTLLGPLYDFAGTWTNQPNQGWNLIAVPGSLKKNSDPDYFNSAHGFILETIPYIETLVFEPISVVLNRGQFPLSSAFGQPTGQQIQQIGAMLYSQTIVSTGCDPSNPNYAAITQFFEERGFAKGTPIHAERGMLLNITNLTDFGTEQFQVARLGTVPHGNVLLCLGNATTAAAPVIDPNGSSAMPVPVDPTRQMPVEYTINTYLSPNHSSTGYPFYPDFIPSNPNQTLINANTNMQFSGTTHLSMSSTNGTGGILSIPFVRGGFDGSRINTTQMTVDYWLSTVKETGALQLQYAQSINLVFPTNLDASLPIIWPHIGLNTLQKISS